MTNLIEKFINIHGDEKTNEIVNYMIDNEIYDQFDNIKNDTIKLFNFGVKYGIIEVVRFLYEKVNIEYDFNVIYEFNSVLDKSINNPQNNLVSGIANTQIQTGSSNDKVSIEIWDKFTHNRKVCISYLVNMMKYSKQRSSNKKFYYKFNPKYSSILAQ